MRTVRGAVRFVAMVINTFLVGNVLLLFALIKFILPLNAVRRSIDRVLNAIAGIWITNNARVMNRVEWDVRGAENLSRRRWYLVEANHQSWTDIFVMQYVLHGRIPFLKFFLKRELIYVPLIGIVWWALDFPFMRRHSPEYLAAHPEQQGKDLDAIRRSCQKFALIPTAVMNFLEGTRFTPEKHVATSSPYRHLLPPKAGGLALALHAMGERFHSLLDVTIFYPHGAPGFFGMLAGDLRKVVVSIRELPIPRELLGGDYESDPEFRARMQEWVRALWREKDALLEQLHQEQAAALRA